LAGESSAEDINWGQIVLSNVPNVGVTSGVGEMTRKNSAAVIIDFDLPDCFDTRPLEAKVKSPYTRE